MEVPKQRARCGPQHCVLGLTDTDTYAQGGNYQQSLRAAVAYESYRTRRRWKRGKGFTQTEWPERQNPRATATVLTFERKLGVRLATLLPAVIFGRERVVLIQS